MESSVCEEPSQESNDQKDQEPVHEMGLGRSYECVFCRRGFDTAQALGGHMNIHRKDRSKNKPAGATFVPNKLLQVHDQRSSTHEHDDHQFKIINLDDHQCSASQVISYATYLPGSGSSSVPDRVRSSLELSGKDDHHHHHVEVKKEDLDLELRLGYI